MVLRVPQPLSKMKTSVEPLQIKSKRLIFNHRSPPKPKTTKTGPTSPTKTLLFPKPSCLVYLRPPKKTQQYRSLFLLEKKEDSQLRSSCLKHKIPKTMSPDDSPEIIDGIMLVSKQIAHTIIEGGSDQTPNHDR